MLNVKFYQVLPGFTSSLWRHFDHWKAEHFFCVWHSSMLFAYWDISHNWWSFKKQEKDCYMSAFCSLIVYYTTHDLSKFIINIGINFVQWQSFVPEIINFFAGDIGGSMVRVIVRNLRVFRILRSLKMVSRFRQVRLIALAIGKAFSVSPFIWIFYSFCTFNFSLSRCCLHTIPIHHCLFTIIHPSIHLHFCSTFFLLLCLVSFIC